MARRSDVLELAVLGLLQESPLHGYALRKRLNDRLGVFAALSFGTLYPALRGLLAKGWVRESAAADVDGPALGRRARIVYEITAEGKEHFQALVSSPGPDAWEDGTFDVHFAFFARTDAATRLRILENRRLRLTERMETARQARLRNRERLDEYTLALKSLGEEAVEHEVRWLSELIDSERASNMTHLDDPDKPDPSDTRAAPPD